jgi:hypothetical protein
MTTGLALRRGSLGIEIALRPFSFTIRRAGRRLVRSGGLWVADGTIRDHFIQLTEGVVAREERSPRRAACAPRSEACNNSAWSSPCSSSAAARRS